MSLNVQALKREFEIRTWSRIIGGHPYVAVVHITGGRSWGRANTKARVLGDSPGAVGARFASAKHAREGARRTRFVGLAELFRGCPAAVVYGADAEAVAGAARRARDVIDGGVLVGGRFGDEIVTARAWEAVLRSEGRRAEWARLVRVLAAPPALARVLDAGGRGLAQSVEAAGGAARLARVLDRVAERG